MLYGRDTERGEIGVLLDAARRSRSGVLVLRGEPGVGKTALLEDARARAPDMQILSARGIESEAELAFAGLHQLIRPALHLVEGLPTPQAAALRGALGLVERPGADRFLISLACLTLLDALADRRPVLCLVDDAQWLDPPSIDALRFVGRRLDAEGIVMLFGVREGDRRRFDAPELPSLELRPLEPEAAAAVLAAAVGGDVAPTVRTFLLEQARGNALALVELPAALTPAQLAGAEPVPAAVPLTRGVERLFLERVRQLPQDTQRLLLVVAADSSRSLVPVTRAAQVLGLDPDALGAAEEAGLISVSGSRLDVRHPLVRSAIYYGSSTSERRAAHLALAEALSEELESDQRAFHRAAGAFGVDADVADELERTATRAQLRSGHGAAATALERAADLSPDDAARARRLVAAASAAWHAGQPDRATSLLDHASPLVSNPRLRAEVDHVQGEIQLRRGALFVASETLIAGAVRVSSLDPRKALMMLFDAAKAGVDGGDYARVAEAGRHVAALTSDADDEVAFLANLLLGITSLIEGKSATEAPRVLAALARVEKLNEPRWLAWGAVGAGVAGDMAREVALLERAVARARESGSVGELALVLESLAVEGIVAGRHDVMAEATEGLKLARETGLPNAGAVFLAVLAWFAGVEGEDALCRGYVSDVVHHARANGLGVANSLAEWGLALLDLGAGRPDDAASRLHALGKAPPGLGHPYMVMVSTPDLVEAAVRAGREELARDALLVLRGFARPGAPAWALALAARCRALLAESSDADTEFGEALRLHAQGNRPFDRARTELLYGESLRRDRRRAEARPHLRAALEAFEALGASPWAERARSELRASGETARRRDLATVPQLTPQELQVAQFVAEGLSNKEVAAQLFLSPRTIDAHLRNVFAKLGITSRTQLARMLLTTGASAHELAGAANLSPG